MLYALLALSTLTAAGKTILLKKIGVDAGSTRQLFASNAASFLFAAFFSLLFSGFRLRTLFNISSYSLSMAVLFALCVVVTYLSQTKAMSCGNGSTTMLIYSTGFLVPILFGSIFYRETVSVVQLLSLGLLLIALVLILRPSSAARIKPSLTWIFFSFLSAFGSGMIAVLQKIHQRSSQADEFALLLTWEFIIAGTVLSLITALLTKPSAQSSLTKKRLLVAGCSGFFVCALNTLNIRLAGKLPAIIVFPIYNIGNLILSGVLCAILFREKISRRELLGFGIGCVALLLIGIF